MTDKGTIAAPAGTIDERALEEQRTPAADPLVNGRYRVARRIGKGGMGEVMGARDEQIGRDVAIKRMRAATPSERAVRRFLREASIQGRLEHPAIVPVHEIGHDPDGLPFFVMKKLAGTTLAKILEDRRRGDDSVSLQKILRALAEVCLAVEFAHVRGVIHRDLKPDNIILGDFGEVYVLDWGVAKVVGEADSGFADVDSHSGSGEHATIAGTALGTPGYMAPEQVRALDVDGRADVYSLGCILFELLAGEPLNPRGRAGLETALLRDDNRPSARAKDGASPCPPELDALCSEATRVDRSLRIPTARALADRILQYLDGDRDLALRRTIARAHLERAREAFEQLATGEAHRVTAMREAAAALALDPAHASAAELVGRLMLEPPREPPREVEEALRADDVRAAKLNAQAGMAAALVGLLLTPLMWWLAPSRSPYVFALTAVMLGAGLVGVYNYRARQPFTGLVVVGNAILVAVIARMFSPVLVAPGLAALLAMAMVLTPRFSWLGSVWTVAGTLVAAVLGPLVLERLGAISPTFAVSPHGIVIDAPAIANADGPFVVVACVYATMLILVASLIGEKLRARSRDAHRHLMTQAWQLRQLVPAGTG